uniref:non-specific serine/threonine protein kinase n=1 Tax=Aureoumbra lagunensis TaxID=44058 RepID=A0A7S3NDD0_9STRA
MIDLGDDYEVIGVLGQGSFGSVWKIRRLEDGLFFACKSVVYSGMDQQHKEQLVTEVNVMRDLQHPHIVRYIDRHVDKKNGTLHIILELCQGGDLAKKIRDRKRQGRLFSEERIWQLLREAALALNDCHAKHLIHRDLKPANLLFGQDDQLKIADFGLCKELKARDALARTKLGTPLYMAPELVQYKPYGASVDLWSLGCVAHETAALAPPFDEKNAEELKVAILSHSIRNHIPSSYSQLLKTTISKLLHPNPKARLSAADLLSTCNQFLLEKLDCVTSSWSQQQLLSFIQERKSNLDDREKLLDRRERNLDERERKLILREKAENSILVSKTRQTSRTWTQAADQENNFLQKEAESTKRRRRA